MSTARTVLVPVVSLVASLSFAAAGAACGNGGTSRACGVCTAYGDPVVAGNVNTPAVNELSGIAASKKYDDVYYVQDDDPVPFDGLDVSVHAIDDTGALIASWQLDGARVGNLEDIAVGPCPQGTCVYTGDIGNNSGDASPYPIYRFPEPAIDRNAPPASSLISDYETIWVEYPDGGPHDCEAMAVRPDTGDIYLIEKKTGSTAGVFHVPPWPAAAATGSSPTLTMTKVADLSLVPDGTTPEDQLVTGADFHPCEPRMLVHTYSHAYEYTLPAGATDFEDIFRTAPVKVRNPGGSESIGYLWDGNGYLSVPEGQNPPLTVVRCAPDLDAGTQ
ncbi:MAG TPA: hypothetical protein VHE35_29205 [Kofleriaceae bacterium]|nr:hypothetical protein [Kofleriaceae bacterium]